jgi:two-component system, OmpR family, sensor histidine kinase KdpD
MLSCTSAPSRAVRVLLCFDEKPAAQALIRGAVRLATERAAELYALYVEPPGAGTRRTPERAAQLARNQRLADDLGAQVTVVHSHRIADTILAFAEEHAIDLIVLGRAQHPWWRQWLGGDIAKQLAARSTAVDVQILDC